MSDFTMSKDLFVKRLRKLASVHGENQYRESEHRLGWLLTIIDSAVSDPEQRKATKDLVRQAYFSNQRGIGVKTDFDLFAESFGLKLYEDVPKVAKVDDVGVYNPFLEIK